MQRNRRSTHAKAVVTSNNLPAVPTDPAQIVPHWLPTIGEMQRLHQIVPLPPKCTTQPKPSAIDPHLCYHARLVEFESQLAALDALPPDSLLRPHLYERKHSSPINPNTEPLK
jgi:hypothetical protein